MMVSPDRGEVTLTLGQAAHRPLGDARAAYPTQGNSSPARFAYTALAQDWPRPRLTQPRVWHNCGMARTRLSTTVNTDLLADARRVRSGGTDAALIDAALEALLARHRAAELDASYAAYDEHPLDEPDEWGDLASFRKAAAAS